jgi:predicted enzyme related to lactoylglutathione lyase
VASLACALLLAPGCANNPKTQSAGALVEAMGATSLYSPAPAKLADWYTTRFRLPFRPEGAGFITKDDNKLGSILMTINPTAAGAKEKAIDIFFFVRNLDRVLGQLSDVGTSPLRIDTDEHGRPKAIVIDPDGNRIELVQR